MRKSKELEHRKTALYETHRNIERINFGLQSADPKSSPWIPTMEEFEAMFAEYYFLLTGEKLANKE